MLHNKAELLSEKREVDNMYLLKLDYGLLRLRDAMMSA